MAYVRPVSTVPWNDDSPQWRQVKPGVKQQLKPDGNKHGIFWMEFNEFRKVN
jgi:hypothetical protein